MADEKVVQRAASMVALLVAEMVDEMVDEMVVWRVAMLAVWMVLRWVDLKGTWMAELKEGVSVDMSVAR